MNEITRLGQTNSPFEKASPFEMKMSSKEIAEVTEKEHFNVMVDIRKLISNNIIDQLNFQEISIPDAYGRMQPAYLLDHDATMVLVTGYDAHRRMAVIKRWRELEIS